MPESATAEFMALFRALESARPVEERLFSDPHAERFLRPLLKGVVRLARLPVGRRLVLAAIDRLWPGARASGVARTRLIDDALREAVEHGLEQVVALGAGFDCRAHRLGLPSAVAFVELDRPETQEQKRRCLGQGIPAGRVRYAPCDFEEMRLPDCLARAGFAPDRPSFFLWEGVTNYLSSAAVDAVLHFVSANPPGTRLLFSYIDRLAIDEPERYAGTRLLRALLQRSREPWTFGLDPSGLEDFLKARGLRLVSDTGSLDFRARYLGAQGKHLKGYEFYRLALATVEAGSPLRSAKGGG
jgi:methyltransferase (TIGR00027 family)